MLISNHEDQLEIPEPFFGHQAESINSAKVVILSSFSVLAIMFSIPSLRDILFDGVAGIIFISLLVLLTIAPVCIFTYLIRLEMVSARFNRKVNKSYDEWYLNTLIPFLDQKYDVTINRPTETKFCKGLFANHGELATTSQGKIIKVKLGGLEPYEGMVYSDKNEKYVYVRATSLRTTLNGKIWLNKINAVGVLT